MPTPSPKNFQEGPGFVASTKKASSAARRVMGVRVDALIETAVFLVLALAIDMQWGSGDRFAGMTPHPFWIVVLLASSYYGMREGLAAAALASAALLFGHLPEQMIGESTGEWSVRWMIVPAGWGVAALALGGIQAAFRRRLEAVQHELSETRDRLRTLTAAYERLHRLKHQLETRISGHTCTVNAMYKAWCAIEQNGVGDVLVGVSDLMRTVMNPEKFSLYLLNGSRLDAVANGGWAPGDRFASQIDASFPLYQAVVKDRRFLSIVERADEPLLRDEGVLAGPIVNADSGAFVGMLKIEAIGFLDLNPESVQNFRTLCDWIGAALAHAERVERMQGLRAHDLVNIELPAGVSMIHKETVAVGTDHDPRLAELPDRLKRLRR